MTQPHLERSGAKRVAEDWNANQYLRFEAERTRPARDLLAAVTEGARRSVVDLGCGPGNSTELLLARYPQAHILGVDPSPAMLASARRRLPAIEFIEGDAQSWRANAPVDLIFANAVMQWVPRHIEVMAALMTQLAPGGVLAVQAPDNLSEPAHVLMRETAKRGFAQALAAEGVRDPLGAFADYVDALTPLSSAVDVWRTTYAHRLADHDAIVEWFKGSGLRPYLDALPAERRPDFLAAYRAELPKAFPILATGGVLLPFPRLFVVATRRG